MIPSILFRPKINLIYTETDQPDITDYLFYKKKISTPIMTPIKNL